MGNLSKNLNSVESVSVALVQAQKKSTFFVKDDYNHPITECTLALCVGGTNKDYPMVLFMFADGRRPVAVSKLPDDMFVIVGGEQKLASTTLRVGFADGELIGV